MGYQKSSKQPEPDIEIRQLFRSHYRLAESSWVGGDNKINVTFGEIPEARSESTKVWHKKHCWSGTQLEVWLSVSPKWRNGVRDRGLAILDGLLTTHAGRVRRHEGIEVYPATWIRKGRGLSIRPESGWIALHRESGTSYHLVEGTAKKAVVGLRRKLKLQAIPQSEKDARRRQRAETKREGIERLVRRLAAHDLTEIGEVVVTRQDSLRAGNCLPGTDAFIDTFFPHRTSATIAEISKVIGHKDLGSLDDAHLTLARQIGAACLMALRRAKENMRSQRLTLEHSQSKLSDNIEVPLVN